MKIPPYWARGRYEGKDRKGIEHTFFSIGWSFDSLQQARAEASAKAKRIFEFITAGRKPERYEYHNRPIREEILKEIHDGDALIAVITRNRYGALVLNCSNALFVDVDFPRSQPVGLLAGLLQAFSRKRSQDGVQATVHATIQAVEQWAERNPDRSFRLYRTKEGLRLLFTDRLYEPASAETAVTLSELKADPLYVMLTRKQECFRARLTSKPWRCGSPRPPNAFPWDHPEAEAAFRKWENAYTMQDAKFKICELIRTFGSPADIRSLQTIVELHDRGARIHADADLA